MPKLAANLTTMFTEDDFLDRFAAAAACGFQAVEFLFPYAFAADVVSARLKAAGLAQALFNMPPGDWEAGERGVAALPGREAEFAAGIDTALRYARALDCRQVHCLAGLVADEAARPAMRETYLRNLATAAARCKAQGVRLLIEPINSHDMPGYFLSHSWQAREIVETVGSDNLFLQYDCYHMQIMEGDLLKTIEANLDIIRHFQIAGVPDRHEPDTGEICYPFLFAALDRLGYDGWWGCEYVPAAGTREGLGWARPWGIGI